MTAITSAELLLAQFHHSMHGDGYRRLQDNLDIFTLKVSYKSLRRCMLAWTAKQGAGTKWLVQMNSHRKRFENGLGKASCACVFFAMVMHVDPGALDVGSEELIAVILVQVREHFWLRLKLPQDGFDDVLTEVLMRGAVYPLAIVFRDTGTMVALTASIDLNHVLRAVGQQLLEKLPHSVRGVGLALGKHEPMFHPGGSTNRERLSYVLGTVVVVRMCGVIHDEARQKARRQNASRTCLIRVPVRGRFQPEPVRTCPRCSRDERRPSHTKWR